MKELFKWMASHPDVKIEIEHLNDMYPEGYLCLTMTHKTWNSKAMEMVIFDLIDVATNPDDILIWTLDAHYKELIGVKAKEIDAKVKSILEAHNENCKHG